MNIMVITDNDFLYREFNKIIGLGNYNESSFQFRYSYNNEVMKIKYSDNDNIKSINIKESINICLDYDLIISLHCKQIFPNELVNSVRCINIHPGYNPYNRGWFPQAFSIINKKQLGVTIHEMDEELDHGSIILREKIDINPWETSYDVYQNIMRKEVELISKYLNDIIDNNYESKDMEDEGNINYLKDFKALCKLDLNEELTMGEAIDRLRALTFDGYKNAYFEHDGKNIYVSINIETEK